MKKLLLLITLFMFSVSAFAAAGGGKVNNPWQPIDPDADVCTAFLPSGIDLEDCLELASTTSGITYLCGMLDDYVVMCPTVVDDGPNSDPDNESDDEDD